MLEGKAKRILFFVYLRKTTPRILYLTRLESLALFRKLWNKEYFESNRRSHRLPLTTNRNWTAYQDPIREQLYTQQVRSSQSNAEPVSSNNHTVILSYRKNPFFIKTFSLTYVLYFLNWLCNDNHGIGFYTLLAIIVIHRISSQLEWQSNASQ